MHQGPEISGASQGKIAQDVYERFKEKILQARQCGLLKLYHIASATLEGILKQEFDDALCIELAFCYLDNDQFELAKATLERIPNHATNKSAIQALSTVYQKQRDLSSAMSTLDQYPNWQEDFEILCTKAVCLHYFNKIDEAIQIFEGIPNKEIAKDERFLFSYARCRESKGHYSDAIRLYKLASVLNPVKSLQYQARCYETMGAYPEALQTHEQCLELGDRDYIYIDQGR